jgi:hypothetical protein
MANSQVAEHDSKRLVGSRNNTEPEEFRWEAAKVNDTPTVAVKAREQTIAHEGGKSFAGLFLPEDESARLSDSARDRVFAEIDRLDLLANVGELEMRGYTVLRPAQVGPAEFTVSLRDKIIELIEKRQGEKIDLDKGISGPSEATAFGQVKYERKVLLEDPVFQTALMNPAMLAIVTYLLGESCTLHHQRAAVKYPGGDYLPMHADVNQSGALAPFTSLAQVCNATYLLTDHTADAGTTCFVPGSHKLCRPPTAAEATDLSSFVPLVAPEGSVAIWHGNTWHGAIPRSAPGVRVSLVHYFQRWYYGQAESFEKQIDQATLDRNATRFKTLVGLDREYLQGDTAENAPRFRAIRTGMYV